MVMTLSNLCRSVNISRLDPQVVVAAAAGYGEKHRTLESEGKVRGGC